MFSKRARYALHGVGYLAYHHGGPPMPFTEILRFLESYSHELTLSPGYISKIFQDLSRAQIVQSALGRKGGYTLARHPSEVRVVDIVTAVDGSPIEQCCMLSIGGCNNQKVCGVNQLIQQAQESFYNFLASETAESLSQKVFGDRGPDSFLQDDAQPADPTPAQEPAPQSDGIEAKDAPSPPGAG